MIIAAASATLLVLLSFATMNFFKQRWDPRGKHCYITGGSSGLGLALAIILAKKGADVSIVARDRTKLDDALKELENVRQTPDQKLKAYSFSLCDPKLAEDALEAACAEHGGRSPDAILMCAGAAHPRFFIESQAKDLQLGMDNAYWVQAYTAWVAAKRMVRTKTQGKIVFVGSILSYMSFVGYSSYSPGKYALRGLAETLRSELQLYDISVQMYFPATIFSPGYEQEMISKPQITKKLEETDGGQTPEQCAQAFFEGISRGDFHITGELFGHIFRSSSSGVSPGNNIVLDTVYSVMGLIGMPIWRRSVDTAVRAHKREHEQYLQSNGFHAAK